MDYHEYICGSLVTANFIWSFSVVSCENATAPANAQLKLVNRTTTYGSEAQVTCNHGYYLVGSEKRHCLVSGQWSGRQPSCQSEYSRGKMTENVIKKGFILQYNE